MRDWLRDVLASVAVGLILPGMVLNGAVALWNRAQAEYAARQTPPPAQISLPVKIRWEEGDVTQGQMDEYLVGVLLAEMPASFESEALKAQAVVARTYARKAWETGGKHEDGSVCVLPACCQGYRKVESYLEQGGRPEDVEKIRQAVQSTSGQVLTYEGALIEATYFSCSGGSTEDAVAVWGMDVPYLRSVDSPGEEAAAYYRDQVTLTAREVAQKLETDLAGAPETWVGKITYTAGGGVEEASIGGRVFTGTEVRYRLGLRSAAFSVEVGEDSLTFTTKGFGHRVGMSQYGADAMAAAGSSYEEILAHYYRDTTLIQLSPDS